MEPETSAFPGKDEEGTTEETPQREGHHPATQKACQIFWKPNAPTVKQIMDKLKKDLETQEKGEESGPNSGSQSKDPRKTK